MKDERQGGRDWKSQEPLLSLHAGARLVAQHDAAACSVYNRSAAAGFREVGKHENTTNKVPKKLSRARVTLSVNAP